MKQVLTTTTVILLIFLWVYTALAKLSQLNTSVVFLMKSPLAPVARQLAIAIPALELLIAIFLVIPSTQPLGLRCSLVLLTIFRLYIGYMLLYFPGRPCNCGGVINTMTWTQHIIFNIFFIAITALSIKWFHHKRVVQPGHAEHLQTK
jgi:hypothetical protein